MTTPDFDDEMTIERIAAAKRRLTDLKLRALLQESQARPRADDIDAVADEILARLDRPLPAACGNGPVRTDIVVG